jgi:hypothetical protein
MTEVLELRCILEEGQLIKQIMTGATILMIVEAGICITAVTRYYLRND